MGIFVMIVVSFFFQVIKSASESCSSYVVSCRKHLYKSLQCLLSAVDCPILFNADRNEV